MPDDSNSRFWTIPNAICIARFFGSFALLPIAIAGLTGLFIGTYLVLVTTDLIDGPIARRFKQRSDIGAHLDTLADVTLNACLLVGVSVLCWDALRHELILIGVVIATYGLSQGLGLWKYRRLLSYHTYAAKITQWLAMLAAVCLVLDWSIWPLRIAAVCAILGNIEAIAITFALPNWRTDVATLFRVWPTRNDSA